MSPELPGTMREMIKNLRGNFFIPRPPPATNNKLTVHNLSSVSLNTELSLSFAPTSSLSHGQQQLQLLQFFN